MTAYTPQVAEARALRSTRERVAGLLKRYPDVSDQDRREIIRFMKEARHLEIGLLTANERLQPKLDAFMNDHRRHFQIDLFDIVRMLAVLAAAFMVGWLLFELVRPAGG